MTLITVGYWQTTFWAEDYWQQDYWLEYGTASAVAAEGGPSFEYRQRRVEPVKTKPFRHDLLILIKQYLEMKQHAGN